MDVRGAAGTGFFRGDGPMYGTAGWCWVLSWRFAFVSDFVCRQLLRGWSSGSSRAPRRPGTISCSKTGAAAAVSHRAAGVDLFPVAAGLSAGIRHGGVRAETAADLRDRRGVAVCQRFSQSAARCGRPEGGIAGETAERTDADRTGDRLFRLHHTHYIDPDRPSRRRGCWPGWALRQRS